MTKKCLLIALTLISLFTIEMGYFWFCLLATGISLYMAAFCLLPTFLLRLDFSYWWVRFLYTLYMDILISNHFPSFTCFQVVIFGQICLFLYIRLTRTLLWLVSIKVGGKKISNSIWFNLNGFLIAFEVTFKEFVLTPRLYKVSQALVCARTCVWISTVFSHSSTEATPFSGVKWCGTNWFCSDYNTLVFMLFLNSF